MKKFSIRKLKNNIMCLFTEVKPYRYKTYTIILSFPKIRFMEGKSSRNLLTKSEFSISADTGVFYIKDFYGYSMGIRILGFGLEIQKSNIYDLFDEMTD